MSDILLEVDGVQENQLVIDICKYFNDYVMLLIITCLFEFHFIGLNSLVFCYYFKVLRIDFCLE